MSENPGITQPKIKTIKSGRGRALLFNGLGLIILLILAILAGYGSGISIRRDNQTSVLSQQLGEQFQFALVDMQFGRYANARQRFEFIIANDPGYPGAQQKLTEVLVWINVPRTRHQSGNSAHLRGDHSSRGQVDQIVLQA